MNKYFKPIIEPQKHNLFSKSIPVAQLKKAINKEKYVVHITVIQ